MRAFVAHYRFELVTSLRNGEQLLVNIVIPLSVLLFFSQVDVLSSGADDIGQLAPGVLALAVMSASLVSLGVGTGFERFYGVLKRLGTTPLGRGRWVGAKLLVVATTIALQFCILIPVVFALGWEPSGKLLGAGVAAALGVLAFGGLGMLMAGTLPGMVNLAACNGAYILLLLTGGMVIPLDDLPGALRSVVKLLPAAALSQTFIGSLSDQVTAAGSDWFVLALWAIALPLAAARLFRWR